jgi:hypothetical protein
MTFLLVSLVILAGLSLGLRTTSVVMDPGAHPLDRLTLAIIAGALWTAVVLEVSSSYRIFDFGLGLMLSLSPAGLFDVTKWWFRSRGRRGRWLRGNTAPSWLLALRWLVVVALIAAPLVALIRADF